MYAIIIISVFPLGVLILAVIAKSMRYRYINKHAEWLNSMELSDKEVVASLTGLQCWYRGIKHESIVHPIKKVRVGFEELYDDVGLVESRNDKFLHKMRKARQWIKGFLLMYAPISLIMIILIWLYTYDPL